MNADAPTLNEAARIEALRQYRILDTPPEQAFDELAILAAQVCGTSKVFISFIDSERIWAKSQIGFRSREAVRENSICSAVLEGEDIFVLEDALQDSRFERTPIVQAGEARFFAGVPLRVRGKSESAAEAEFAIGVLAVLDTEPRSLPEHQARALRILATQVVTQLHLRRSSWELSRKNAELENALRHSESFYHSLVETIPQNIFRKDRQGRFTFANSRFCEAIQRPVSEVIGRTDFDIFPADLAAKYQQDDRWVLERNTTFSAVEQYRNPDGSTAYVRVIKSPLADFQGNVIGVQGIFWDETERFNAEAALAYERDLLWAMLENIPDSIYFKDRESRFISVSRSLAIRLGLGRPEDAAGKTDLDFFKPEHARQAREDELRIMRTGQPLVAKAERETWLNGSERWVLTTKVPLKQANGEVIGTFGISKDITELKQTETELASARDAALESARLKSEFLANMSHEIRTPLNAVIGMTGLLLDTNLTEDQRDFTETIRRSADALLNIINDILDFSKIEAGKMPIEVIDFDISEVVEGTVELLAESAQSKQVELASWIHEAVPRHLRGDPGRVRQVLTNLVGNAIKFTSQGEVVVNVTTTRESEKTALLRITVRDTGIGIAPESQQRLFQAFVQADGSTTRRFGGTGLGLAISRQLVELMHGEMGFESAPGAGSTFWFELPFEKQAVQQPSMAMASTLEGIRVLIVDDNQTNRDIVHHQVRAWKMRNGSADCGAAALRMLEQANAEGDPFNLAILDMQMPEMDGLSLARRIKENPAFRDVRLIMLTSLGFLPEERKWRECGISAYLIKPVKEGRLYDAIVNVMRGRGAPMSRHLSRPASSPKTVSRNIRILIAEDNVVNQKVALRQLQKLGYSADAVANGAEALEVLKQIPYDIILMDGQMPELDGYEASRRIRELESRAHSPVPVYIIAMTANALAGDREECLNAGMNDYISKPVRLDQLEAAVRRGVNTLNAAPAEEDLLDKETIASIKDLRSPGEPDPLEELITLFNEDTPARIAEIQQAFAASDIQRLEAAAHALKGSAGNLGARPLVEICTTIMEQARSGKLPPAELVAKLGPMYELVKAALEKAKI